MSKRRDLIHHVAANSALNVEPLPGIPLVEISGAHRVLIEGHQGVLEYGQERIMVSTKAENYCIYGDRLEMIKMTRQQLIIQGCIHGVTICRRT